MDVGVAEVLQADEEFCEPKDLFVRLQTANPQNPPFESRKPKGNRETEGTGTLIILTPRAIVSKGLIGSASPGIGAL